MSTDNLLHLGSRYIYDLYYDKEAISKQLYDFLLKNGYADGNLIAKWKKQGYEKVCIEMFPMNVLSADCRSDSYAVYGAYRPKRRILMLHAFVGYPRYS